MSACYPSQDPQQLIKWPIKLIRLPSGMCCGGVGIYIETARTSCMADSATFRGERTRPTKLLYASLKNILALNL